MTAQSRTPLAIIIPDPPDLRARYGYGRPNARFFERLFERRAPEHLAFLDRVADLSDAVARIPDDDPGDGRAPFWRQPWIPVLDGLSLYTLAASFRPKRIVEIGCGVSTRFLARGVADAGLATRITAIDPSPRSAVAHIATCTVAESLEATDLAPFAALEPGDVLFFDGSHRCLQNSDVSVFFFDVLPGLKSGVIVGLHDIFLPRDYPAEWRNRLYNEQYVLGAYLIGRGEDADVLFSAAHATDALQPEIRARLGDALYARLSAQAGRIEGGALWFRV